MWAAVWVALVILGGTGCSQHQGDVKEVKVDAIGRPPAAGSPEASKASEKEKERFRKQVADQAEFFAKQSQSVYASGKKPEKTIWEKLWPWGRKKEADNPRMDLKEFKFTAEYPNQRK